MRRLFPGTFAWVLGAASMPALPSLAENPTPCHRAACMGDRFRVTPLSESERRAMDGRGWQAGCPVGPRELREVHVVHWRPEGDMSDGLLIVHEAVADEVRAAFEELFDAGFVLERVAPASGFGGDDDALMRANVTSAFNCRAMTGGRAFSLHSYGVAIDVNPLWNPWVRGDAVKPEEGRTFADRSGARGRPGVLTVDSPAVAVFERRGWSWGGRWRRLKDWQHFEKAIPKSAGRSGASTGTR